ncbi:hypothetical protein LP085_07955 [Achromobacter sp. MY14]|uniref:hypothetical protein n=1 Tax=unclassified Achromobacter TaxID=2626865 RepID=UPI001E43C606|nr:hypothetical protein [Achromobacter sp. MY14]MCD0496781.1 hypothetical protein [Achromobacter sp. MY14]
MSNFFTPTTKTFSLIELLAFYELGLHVTNYEQQKAVYRFHKKSTNKKTKILSMLNFVVEKVIYSTDDRAAMESYIKAYIAKNCPDAKEIKNGIYQITY